MLQATHIVHDGGHVIGVATGLITATEADLIVRRLQVGADPGPSAPDCSWAAAARRPSREVAATASTMFSSGLFYCVERSELVLGTDPGGVIRARETATELCPDFVRAFALMNTAASRTPYIGVERLPVGQTLLWHPGRPSQDRKVTWSGLVSWGEPKAAGPGIISEYRERFDSVVADLLKRVGPASIQVSGGLDSTFVAGTVGQVLPHDADVLGMCYLPIPQAKLYARGNWDPDDFPTAVLMAKRYPNLQIDRIINASRTEPLDAAELARQRGWWPVFNPDNQVWLDQTLNRAARRGSHALLVGMNGNAAFSPDVTYGAKYHAGRAELDRLFRASAVRADSGWSRRDRIRRHMLAPLAQAVRRDQPYSSSYLRAVGLAHMPTPAAHQGTFNRERHLRWLIGNDSALQAAANPAATGGVLYADPFRARQILDFAAQIQPVDWLRGPAPRGLARLIAADRVPDAIRLRTRRGGQAWDTW